MGHLWPSRSWESHTPASPRPWLDMLRQTRAARSSSVAIIPFVSDGRRVRAEPDLETKSRVADVFGEVFDTYPDIHYDFLMLTRDEFRQRERAVARIQG